jgi:hypothetical protein
MAPPMYDWLEICDKDFSSTELSKMQQQLFCALDFNLGAPLSYRFLRRYARVIFEVLDFYFNLLKLNFRPAPLTWIC